MRADDNYARERRCYASARRVGELLTDIDISGASASVNARYELSCRIHTGVLGNIRASA